MFAVSISMGLAFSSQYPFLISIGSKIRTNATAFSLMVGFGGMSAVIFPIILGWVGDHVNIRIAMMSHSLLFIIVGIMLVSGGYIKQIAIKKG